MKNRFVKYLFRFSFLLIFAIACQSVSKVSRQNLVYLYQSEENFTELNNCLYHTTDSTSTLFIEVLFSNLVYQKDPYTGLYTCSYRLGYKLTSGYESNEILQTASIVSGDSINYGKNNSIIHSFDIKIDYPGNYLLEITLFDFNRQSSTTRYVEADKSSRYGRQNFLTMNSKSGLAFKDYFPPGEQIRIITDQQDLNFLYVNYYNRDFPVARPPYTADREMVFNYKPDSVFLLPVSKGESDWFMMDQPGFYHFRKDTLFREGFTLFSFHEGFPEMYTADQLRYPLRYITTRKEYDSLMGSSNMKAAIDEFWLKSTRTEDRAKILIQKYYSNVEDANRYFTSYLEGWKTDRGLIYTVFGKPDYVYRGYGSEEWIYGEPQNRSSLRYTFVKVKNPFTDNDYMLLRSPTLKESWFVTVQSWRR